MTTRQIANDLLKTYEGCEGTAINPSSWFNEIVDTAKFYNVSAQYAYEAHAIAYYDFINDVT